MATLVDVVLTYPPYVLYMRYLLIPLDSALPAVTDSLNRLGDEQPLTGEEHAALCRLAVRFVWTSQALEGYSLLMVGKPNLQ